MDVAQRAWYGEKGLLRWFVKWLEVYNDRITEAYRLINGELIPRRQYDRALVWCMHVFDVTVLAHQMVSMVREHEDGSVQSVYYVDTGGVVEILKRLENRMNQCRATFDELLTVSAIERMYVALKDERGRTAETRDGAATDDDDDAAALRRYEADLEALTRRDTRDDDDDDVVRPPNGVSAYTPDPGYADLLTDVLESREPVDQPLIDIAVSLEILRAGCDREAVREENLEDRLPPNNVRSVCLIATHDDAAMARQIAEAYLAGMQKTIEGVRVYRMDYGNLLSKWRGESEKNFESVMRWMLERARENATDGRHFDVLWTDNVHALMGQRGGGGGGGESGGEEYLNVIKTTMLQIMDVFNKDKGLSRFALVFSTGAPQQDVDAAFRRRIDNVYEPNPLRDSAAFRAILVRRMLHAAKLNVEGPALERLHRAANVSALQRLVYAYHVHARFVVATEFHTARRRDKTADGSGTYTLQPLKRYFNLNGYPVRASGERTLQAVETGEGPRYFYRPGEVDARNLPSEIADDTVYVLRTDPTDGEMDFD